MPRTRSRNRACSRASATNCRRDAAAAPIPAAAWATGTSSPAMPRINPARQSATTTATSTSSGAAMARLAAGSQRAKNPSVASIRSTTVVARSEEL